MSKETPFFFDNGKYRLFGILHDAEKSQRGAGYVFCYPFAEERLWAQRVFVSFARELARRGNPVLRFDFKGNGDSEGNFEDGDVETFISDIECAMRTLKAKVPVLKRVGLIGLRFGATLAALAAERNDVSRLILWDPINDGSQYMQEILRSNLVTQSVVFKEMRMDRASLIRSLQEGKTVNADGYEITRKLYEGVTRIKLDQLNFREDTACLVVQIDEREKGMKGTNLELGKRFRNSKVTQVREDPFWKEIKRYYGKAENLSRATVEWMDSFNE